MTHDDTLKRAAELLRHMSDAGSTDEYRSCNDCATAIDALREELARQVPFAWATFDGEQSYDLRLYEENEDYREDYIKRNGEKYASWVTPLYTAPQPAQVPVQHPDDEAVGRFAWSKIDPPSGKEWIVLHARWRPGTMPSTSVDELRAMRAAMEADNG